MKRYCLTKCAKRKFSTAGQVVIDTIIGTITTILGLIVVLIVVALVGLLVQLGALAFDIWLFHENTFGIGVSTILGTLLVSVASYWTYTFFERVFKGAFYVAKNITMNIIAPEEAECRLFEECKE